LLTLSDASRHRQSAGRPHEADALRRIRAPDRLLHDPDPAVRERAARNFHDWEAVSLSADPDAPYPARWADPVYRLARARIVTHYFRHRAWLDDGQLLNDAHALADIPGILVQGRLDLAGPLVTAWELARAWPGARLMVVKGAGHSPGDAGMAEAIRAAADHFAAEVIPTIEVVF
jgi:proline iminopeptidase